MVDLHEHFLLLKKSNKKKKTSLVSLCPKLCVHKQGKGDSAVLMYVLNWFFWLMNDLLRLQTSVGNMY